MTDTVLPEKVIFEVDIDGDFNRVIAGIALLDGVENVRDITQELASTREQAERELIEKVKYFANAKEIVEKGKRYLIVNGERKPFGYPHPDKRISYLLRSLTPRKEQDG